MVGHGDGKTKLLVGNILLRAQSNWFPNLADGTGKGLDNRKL